MEDSLGATHRDSVSLRHDLMEMELLLKDRDREIRQLRETTAELAKLLGDVSAYIDEKKSVDERIAEAESSFRAELSAYKEQAKEERMALMEQRVNLKVTEEDLHDSHNRDVSRRAMELLDRRTKEVNDQNFELVRDKLLLANDLEAFRTRCVKLEKENATLRQNNDLAVSAESEHLQRNVRQKKEIADLKRQTKTLEDAMEKAVLEYEGRLDRQEKAHAKVLKELQKERDGARNDAQSLLREVQRLRDLSQKILSERSELENYFHDALREVRSEIVKERRKCIAASSTPFDCVGGYGQTNASALRLESQRRLLLTNEVAPKERSQWTRDKKGLPVLIKDRKTDKGLPRIPAASASHSNNNNNNNNSISYSSTGSGAALICSQPSSALSQSQKEPRLPHSANGVEDAGDGGIDGNDMQFVEDTAPVTLQRIPNAPTLKDIQKVDIGELGWNDKERVLRYLFKRLQRESASKAAAMQRHPVGSPSSDEFRQSNNDVTMPTQELRDKDDITFLTNLT